MFQAVLGASAVESERNLIQMETKDSNRKDLKAPIVSLTLGKKDMVCWKIHFEMCRLIITNRLSIVKDVQSVAEFNTNEGESASTHQYYLEIQYIRKEISKLLFLVICRLTTNEFSWHFCKF